MRSRARFAQRVLCWLVLAHGKCVLSKAPTKKAFFSFFPFKPCQAAPSPPASLLSVDLSLIIRSSCRRGSRALSFALFFSISIRLRAQAHLKERVGELARTILLLFATTTRNKLQTFCCVASFQLLCVSLAVASELLGCTQLWRRCSLSLSALQPTTKTNKRRPGQEPALGH